MSIRTNAPLLGASLLVLASVAPAHAQTSDSALEEVVVTAQKRDQNLQDVPVAVTAITPQAMAANRVRNVIDLNALAPNLMATSSSGGSSLPTFTMRGISSQGSVPGSEKQVGLYIDGVYVGTGSAIFDLAYIDQIEILRGPQGALFGQNATAGAISIRTPEPTGRFGAKMDLTYGNYDQIRAGGQVNLPAMGPFSASLAYMHSERRGDMRNLGAGTTWDFRNAPLSGFGRQTSPKWLGNDNSEAISAALKFEPTDNFSATYKFFWIDKDISPEGSGVLGLNPAFAGGVIGAVLANPATNPALLTPIGGKRPDALNNWWTLPGETRNEGHILTAQWRASDSLTVKNVFGYMKNRMVNPGDQVDGLGGVFVAPGVPFVVLNTSTLALSKQWSNEFQLNYDSKFLTFTAGYLHYDFKSTKGNPPQVRNTNAFTPMPGFVVPTTTQLPPTNHTKSDAVYGQGEFHVTSQVDVVAGYRNTWDDKSGTADVPGLPRSFAYKKQRPSYLAGVNYKPTQDILLYGKYSTAYVAGGSFGGWQWNPETAKSWEAGVKSDLLDRRLRLNLTLFSVKYGDMQFITNGSNLALLTGNPALAPLPVVNANAGDAKAKGFELEATAIPVERLTLGAGLGYTDFKYTRTDPLIVGPINVVEPVNRPKWTLNLYAQYETPPVYGDAYIRFRVDATYRSRFEGVALDPSPTLVDKGDIPATRLINGRIALTDLSVAGHKAEIALWGRNLTNNRNPVYTFSTPFIYPAIYERARTFGVDLNLEY